MLVTSSGSPTKARGRQRSRAQCGRTPAETEDLRRVGGERGERSVERQPVRHRDARRLPHLAGVMRAVVQVGEGDAYAGLVQARGVVERGSDLVERVRQVHERIEDHRHLRLCQLPGHLPRLRPAHDDGRAPCFCANASA